MAAQTDQNIAPASPREGALRLWPRRWRGRIALIIAGLMLAAMGLVASGLSLPAPQWAIARIEARLNAAIAPSLPASRLAISGISLSLGPSFAPRLDLQGVELRNLAGAPVMALPQVEAELAPMGLATGQLHLRALRLSGAKLQVTRDETGALDIAFAGSAAFNLAQIFAQADGFFASDLGQGLGAVSVEEMALSLRDLRAGRVWALGGGTLNITQAGGDVAADLGLALLGEDGAASAGRIDLSLIRASGSPRADLSARLSGISARDVAAQAAPLAFIAALDAPITGQVATTITPQGFSALQASLDIGKGSLAPDGGSAKPLRFESAKLDLSYDPAQGRVVLNTLQVVSDILTLRAGGHADLLRADGSVIAGALAGELPAAFAATLRLDSLQFDRPDLFASPVSFTSGAAHLRLRLAPFSLEMEDFSLGDGTMQLSGQGALAAQAAGWETRLDLKADQISSAKLLGLWPKTLKPGTRDWLDRNLLAAEFRDVRLALNGAAGQRPAIDLRYQFDGLKLTPMRSLPAITDGRGYGAIAGRSFSMVLQSGRATPPLGGDIDLSGSVFTIPDIRPFPATGQITLQSAGSLTATLSLIDQPPFRYMQKSNRAVDFADGTARLTTRIGLPLQKIITLPDITLQVTGEVTDFSSEQLAQGRKVRIPQLSVFVDKAGLRLTGQGDISGADFDAVYTQKFGPEHSGKSRVEGQVQLTNAALAAFGVALPDGMVTGKTAADVEIDLARGAAGQMRLTSDLRGLGLQIGPVGFAKPRGDAGALRADISLTTPPQVTKLQLQAADLTAQGTVSLRRDGSLDEARFAGVTIGKWLAGDVRLTGQGAASPPKMTLENATLDLRFLPKQRSAAGVANDRGLPLSVRLDRLRISDGIILNGVQGEFLGQNGLTGSFKATLEGGTPLQGQLAPSQYGTAVRVTAQNAGAALAQAGIYSAVRGGALDVVLTPRAVQGTYQGELEMAGIRVQNANVLAELLNAISVVGLIDQLSGSGILFNAVTGSFILTPDGVELRQGAATGGSLGVSMQGVYRFGDQALDMQGVISPIYLVNGIGAAISQPGEGVLGFTYRLRGRADAPQVSVNPLSVLLPGFLRDLFKAPKPKLGSTE